MSKENRQLSAAMERFSSDDSLNDFYTLFRYSPIGGLGCEPGVGRRDPSNVIKAGDLYCVWYTRISGHKPVGVRKASKSKRAFKWDLAEIWYATSPDCREWTERGVAISSGDKGRFDDRSVFTPNIIVASDCYYLVYQAVRSPYTQRTKNVIGMAKADSPAGPWKKSSDPILTTGNRGIWKGDENDPNQEWSEAVEEGEWDSHKVHDPGVLVRDGKFWLYYKGQQIGRHPFESKIGVAIADHPEGPYHKHPLNPLTNSGHEVWVWPCGEGVAAMVDWAGPEKNTIQYAEDGLNFEVVAALEDIPPAGGAYIPDKFTDTKDGKGFTWGLCYCKSDWDFLVRFDCDLHAESQKQFPGQRYKHYGTIRDVLSDPVRFGLRREKEE
ncbi:MAG: glycosyl hydrolase [Planctomycetota bacterium]|jgi:hypothetical protein|nr:glycosyl hydrolase [Planctomycetota bacterium]